MQVLARFEGFPVKKLETVRAAASLYLRLNSLVQQTENWAVEPPMSELLEKVTAFFDKVFNITSLFTVNKQCICRLVIPLNFKKLLDFR